jgi:serine/threonine protein kinase
MAAPVPEMTDERWRLLSEYLDQALELPLPARAAWLSALAQRDGALAAEVERALAGGKRDEFGAFLQGDIGAASGAIEGASLIGRAVGPYVIDAEIGYGGMGSVWRAQRADGRFTGTVAIKFVHALWAGRAGGQRFRVEGELLARLDHPNIARLIDAGVLEGSQPYLVLEWVAGQPIDAYCEQRQLSLQQRIELFLSVLAAVTHAHSHLIVHRDVKPSNIFVTGDGVVKLLDFGIAKLLRTQADEEPLTRSSAAPLTPHYAAPEQILGQDVTTATDVYALGLVLYLLLTGRHALTLGSRSGTELAQAIVTQMPPRASTVAAVPGVAGRALAGDLDNILGKALRKLPAERYVSAEAFADDLRRFLNHEPVHAQPDSLTYRTRKFVRRHRGSVLGAALTSLALIVTAAFALWQAHRAAQQRDLALLEARRADSVGEFMSALLGDISRTRSAEAQREYLDHAHELFEQQHFEDPNVRGSLLNYLAGRYEEFGYVEPAINLLQEAKAGQEPVALAQLGCGLANMYDDLGRDDEANREIEAAMRVIETNGDAVRPQVQSECRLVESYVATARGENRRAITAAQGSLAQLDSAGLRAGMPYITALNAGARAEAFAGHNAAAVLLLQRLRASADEQGEPQTIGAWIHQYNQARDLLAGGRIIEAERMSTSLAAASQRFGGDNAHDVALLQATALLALDRPGDAAAALPDSSPPAADANGDPSDALQRALLQIEIHLQRGDDRGAQRQRQAWTVAIEAAARGRGADAVRALRIDALLLLRAGELADAASTARRAAELAVDADGGFTPAAREVALLQAQTALQTADYDAACHYADAALLRARAEAVDPDSSAWVGEALLLRARCEQGLGHGQASQALAAAALPHLQQNLGAGHPWAAQARALFAAAAAAR